MSVRITAIDHGAESLQAKIRLVIDTGCHRTLISEKEWLNLKPQKGRRPPMLKKNKVRFKPFGDNGKLQI